MADTPTPAQQLEPCPFCGGEAYCYAETVTCKKCGCRTAEHVAADYAIATWNRRTPNARALAALEAVEGAIKADTIAYSRPPMRAVTGIAVDDDRLTPLIGTRVLIIPADAVEVSRGE